jgi:hypothetical protein
MLLLLQETVKKLVLVDNLKDDVGHTAGSVK